MTAYLDWNATSPPHPDVIEAIQSAWASGWANPASVHTAGRRARDLVESTREKLGEVLQLEARDVVLTSGGTEANHLALAGADGIVTNRLEHPSIVREAERLAATGVTVSFVEVTPGGLLEPAALEAALRQVEHECQGAGTGKLGGGRPAIVVTVMAANHETGVLLPLETLAPVVHERGAWLHVDAVQCLGRRTLEGLEQADSITVAAHKVRGPKGIGALGLRGGRRVVARGLGGSQERGLRAGTVDAAACAGFGAALARLDRSLAGYAACGALRDRLEQVLTLGARPELCIHGAGAPRLPHVSNFGFEGARGDELVAALDLLGVQVSSGSACAAGTAEPSPVITAMVGLDRARGALRVSFGEESSEADLQALLDALQRLELVRHPSSSSGALG